MNKIRVIVKRPGVRAYATNITPSLKNLETYLGGPVDDLPVISDLAVLFTRAGEPALPTAALDAFARSGLLSEEIYIRNVTIYGVDIYGPVVFAGRAPDGELTDCPMTLRDARRYFRLDED